MNNLIETNAGNTSLICSTRFLLYLFCTRTKNAEVLINDAETMCQTEPLKQNRICDQKKPFTPEEEKQRYVHHNNNPGNFLIY